MKLDHGEIDELYGHYRKNWSVPPTVLAELFGPETKFVQRWTFVADRVSNFTPTIDALDDPRHALVGGSPLTWSKPDRFVSVMTAAGCHSVRLEIKTGEFFIQAAHVFVDWTPQSEWTFTGFPSYAIEEKDGDARHCHTTIAVFEHVSDAVSFRLMMP